MSLLAQMVGEIWAMEPQALEALAEDVRTREIAIPEGALVGRGTAKAERKPYDVIDGVAVLPISGPLMPNPGFWARLFGIGSYADISHMAAAAAADDDVRSVLLDVDSPGGSVTGLLECGKALSGIGKPITAYVGGMCASAAYLLAATADRIVVSPAARIGSLGAMAQVGKRGPEADKFFKVLTFVSDLSPLKNADPESEAGADSIQAMVNELGATYLEAVGRYRGLGPDPKAVAEKYGRGAVFAARQAKERGLVDAIELVGGVSAASQDNEESAMDGQPDPNATAPGLGDASRSPKPIAPPASPADVTAPVASTQVDVSALVAAEVAKARADMEAALAAKFDAKVKAEAEARANAKTLDLQFQAACNGRAMPALKCVHHLLAQQDSAEFAAAKDLLFGAEGIARIPDDIPPPAPRQQPEAIAEDDKWVARLDEILAENGNDYEAADAQLAAEMNGGER